MLLHHRLPQCWSISVKHEHFWKKIHIWWNVVMSFTTSNHQGLKSHVIKLAEKTPLCLFHIRVIQSSCCFNWRQNQRHIVLKCLSFSAAHSSARMLIEKSYWKWLTIIIRPLKVVMIFQSGSICKSQVLKTSLTFIMPPFFSKTKTSKLYITNPSRLSILPWND